MPSTIHADRVWIIGGAATALLLSVLAWFFLISPQNAETAALDQQVVVEHRRIDTLRHHLAELREQNTRLASYESDLKKDQNALPRMPELDVFIRELQAAAAAAKVSVNSLTVGTPTATPAGTVRAYAVPLTLTAAGAGVDLQRFLQQLQQVQARAVLVSAVNAMADGDAGSLAGSSTVNLTMSVFTTLQGEAPKETN